METIRESWRPGLPWDLTYRRCCCESILDDGGTCAAELTGDEFAGTLQSWRIRGSGTEADQALQISEGSLAVEWASYCHAAGIWPGLNVGR